MTLIDEIESNQKKTPSGRVMGARRLFQKETSLSADEYAELYALPWAVLIHWDCFLNRLRLLTCQRCFKLATRLFSILQFRLS